MSAVLEHAYEKPDLRRGRDAVRVPEKKSAPTAKRRLECRVQEDVHQTLEWAAHVSGRTVTDLVVAGALREARETLENNQVIQMAREAQVCFAEMLINPPEPNEAFKKAEASHKRLIRSR